MNDILEQWLSAAPDKIEGVYYICFYILRFWNLIAP